MQEPYKKMTILIISTGFLLILINAAFASRLLFTVTGEQLGEDFGESVSNAGDINKDGFDDFIVGANRYRNCTIGTTGSAWVYSGKDGSVIYKWCGDPGDVFGASVSNAGDVNNDGTPDIIIGSTMDSSNTTTNSGSTKIFSGRDGSLLYTFYGDSITSFFGHAVKGIGDINIDGFDEVAIGAIFDDNGGFDAGLVRVFSGFDGTILYSFFGDAPNNHLGQSIAGIGDINQDGYRDIIAGAEELNGANPARGYVRLYSGKDGAIIDTIYGDSSYDTFGWSVDRIGDIDQDLVDDFVVGAPGISPTLTNIAGYARIFSGATRTFFIYYFRKKSKRLFWIFSKRC